MIVNQKTTTELAYLHNNHPTHIIIISFIMCHKTMQTFKNHSKYFIIAALTLSIIWGVFAQVSIPTGLTNAIQYIRETVWTDNGTDSWLVNVQIDDTNMYIRTGFLYNGTGWNNKALWVDNSGNVVYVDANAISSPLIFPSANYIPKINGTQDGLDPSRLYQVGGLIGLNTTNPVKSLDILGDFQVMTQWSSMTFSYQFDQSVTTSNLLSILQNSQCWCDTTNTAAECSAPFAATQLDPAFCIDITGPDTNNPGYYFFDRYENIATGIPDPVLVTLGRNVGIGTANPITDLHVSGSWFAVIETGTLTKQLTVLNDMTNFGLPMWSFGFATYWGVEKLTISTLGTNVTPDVLINPSRWCMLVIFWNCVRYIQPPKVWIGLNNPSQMLEVAWQVRANWVILSSDESLKENITPITNALGRIQDIQGIYYTWVNNSLPLWEDESPIGNMNNNWNLEQIRNSNPEREWQVWTQIWFSAQDIQEAFSDIPSIVSMDNNWILWVNYIAIIPVLVEAIKEQQTIIEDLEFRVSNLEEGPIE